MALWMLVLLSWVDGSLTLETVNQGVQDVYSAVVKSDGTVDYATLDQRPDLMEKLQAFVDYFQTFDPETLADEKAKIAAYANAYNVFTLVGVMDAWPVESVRKIHPLFGFFTKNKFRIAGQKLSLNDIEKKQLQPRDNRIHFIINCASISCPVIQPEILTPQNLESIMDRAARAFLADSSKNQFDRDSGVWHLSKIFDWYGKDWGGEQGVVAYIRKTYPAGANWQPKKVKYQSYEWGLNGPSQR